MLAARGPLGSGRFLLLIVVAALVAGALSLLVPSTPSYDPWSWIVWGREIIHGHLATAGGPSWKPMPVVFTTVFALFGKAAPNLWLIVARAGAAASLFMVFRLAARLTWWLRPAASGGRDSWADLLPCVLAGGFAMAGVALGFGGFGLNSILGYSEGIMMFAALAAVERALDGHHRQAFTIGTIAALDRPEIWVFWGPYGLWLMWRDPGARALVIGLALLVILLWFVPQQLGGGSLPSGVARAHQPRGNSAAFKPCPFCSEISDVAWRQVQAREKVAALLVVLAAIGIFVRALAAGRPVGSSWRRRELGERERGILVAGLLALSGLAWWVIVAIETQAGFSGNTRYLVLGSAAIRIAGGVGFAGAAIVVALLLRSAFGGVRGALAGGLLAVTTAAAAAVALFLPNWFGDRLVSIGGAHRSMSYQSRLRLNLEDVIAQGGGAAAIRNCGNGLIIAEGFQVPMLSWYLGVTLNGVDPNLQHLSNGQPDLTEIKQPWPSVVFQDAPTGGKPVHPSDAQIRRWEARGADYQIFSSTTFHLYKDCRK